MAVREIVELDCGFYERVDRLARLLTPENVVDVMAMLSSQFRVEFIQFCETACSPRAPRSRRVVLGNPLPRSFFKALRTWRER